MKTCEAIMNENGTIKGGTAGDQTGKELQSRDFYIRKGGWNCCLVPVSPEMGAKAADFARRIVASRKCGYDQEIRWSLYKQLKAHKWNVEEIEPCSCDCSSFVITCYIAAGANLLPTGYTGNLERLLIESGDFKRFSGGEQYGCIGAIYVAKNAHALIITDMDEPPIKEPARDRVRAKGSVRVRETPKTGKTIAIAHKGDILEVYGSDDVTGWYKTSTGYVTNNERYTEKI